MAEGGVAGAEVVERHPAAQLAHRAHEARRLLDVLQRRRLGDLDDQAAGHLRPVLQPGDKGPQPRALGSG